MKLIHHQRPPTVRRGFSHLLNADDYASQYVTSATHGLGDYIRLPVSAGQYRVHPTDSPPDTNAKVTRMAVDGKDVHEETVSGNVASVTSPTFISTLEV